MYLITTAVKRVGHLCLFQLADSKVRLVGGFCDLKAMSNPKQTKIRKCKLVSLLHEHDWHNKVKTLKIINFNGRECTIENRNLFI